MAKAAENAAPKKRASVYKNIFFCFMLTGFSFVALVAMYILRLDAWHEFDLSKIIYAQQSALVYDAQNEMVSCLAASETRIWAPLNRIPLHVQRALLAAEDARFYEHIGVDFIRIIGAAWEDLKAGGYVQGASTINQQLVKLSHLTKDKVMSRKLEEAVLAYQMEQLCSKDEILEMYLNYVYFGGGFYGIQAAARGYFGVSAKELTVAQGAQLIGVLKSPSKYAPHLDMKESISRRNLILELMRDYGYLSEEDCKKASAEKAVLTNSLNKNVRGYYIDLALEQAGAALEISMNDLLNGGYHIYTAMDMRLQTACEEMMLDKTLFPEAAQDVQAAMVVVDINTGGVVALMGGRESTTALGYNRATRIRRQPGSVIKPIIAYAPALEYEGYTTVSMLLDQPTDFNGYRPSNFNNKYRGWVTLRESVAQSLNVPAVKVLEDIGVSAGKEFASQLGIEFTEKDTSLTLALGGFTYGVSPYQVAGAYAAFASGGAYSAPTLVMRIANRDGEIVYAYQPEKKRVMSEANAYILTDMLKSAIQEGTGSRLGGLGIELAGKTGTTGDDRGNRDAWMAVYNPEYAAAVWMGYDDALDGKTLPLHATGGNYPALLLKEVFETIYTQKAAPVFAKPGDVVEIRLDGYTLENENLAVLANALTPGASVVREVFVAGTEPKNSSSYWAVPFPPTAFTVESNIDGYPVISFTPDNPHTIYRLYREDMRKVATLVGEWTGDTAVRYMDTALETGVTYQYYVVPVHPQLRIGGRQVVGPATLKRQIFVPLNPFISSTVVIEDQ
ncbi:MAG: PBP1A family penicillin-binding protein [Clostridiales bacterium]|nr:PBP1A family penicillin-binding protein [Clostridiales bacterium]